MQSPVRALPQRSRNLSASARKLATRRRETLVPGELPQPGREMADLERALLRHGVDRRAADRARCASCGRTPLVGERVYPHDGPHAIVCELCHPRAQPAR
jgi:hypothetical protein